MGLITNVDQSIDRYTQKKGGNGAIQEQSCYILLELSQY